MKSYTFISGATGGLGSEFARFFAEKGSDLFITGRSEDKLLALKTELLRINPEISVELFPCQLCDEKARRALFERVDGLNLQFERLINVAGADIQKAFLNYTEEKLVFQSRVLFEATVSLTRYFLSKNPDNLKILTVSSMCGTMPMPYFAVYSALKGALVDFFDALRVELKDRKGVVITTVLPGSITTRPDIIEDIKKQGLTGKLSKKTPRFVVEKSVRALEKRKKNYIPGGYNRLVRFFERLTPKPIKMKIVADKFGKKEKDAF